MAIVPHDNPVFQEDHYQTVETERLDRFPPVAAIEQVRQLVAADPRWIRIAVAAETIAALALVLWFLRQSLWIVARMDSDAVAVLLALLMAALIYAAFGRRG